MVVVIPARQGPHGCGRPQSPGAIISGVEETIEQVLMLLLFFSQSPRKFNNKILILFMMGWLLGRSVSSLGIQLVVSARGCAVLSLGHEPYFVHSHGLLAVVSELVFKFGRTMGRPKGINRVSLRHDRRLV